MRKVVKPTNRGQAAASTQRRGACKMQMRAGSGSPARTQRTKGEENLSSANQIKLSPKNHHHHPLSQSNQIVPRLEICPCVLKLALDRIIPLPYLLRAGYTKSRTFGIWRARLEHPDRCWGEFEATTHAHFSLSIQF